MHVINEVKAYNASDIASLQYIINGKDIRAFCHMWFTFAVQLCTKCPWFSAFIVYRYAVDTISWLNSSEFMHLYLA